MKKEIRLMLEYECYPLWIYDEKGSLIDNDLIDEIKKDDTLCGMLEGLQTEFERLYVNNQIEYLNYVKENKTVQDGKLILEKIVDGLKKIEESGGDYDDIIEALELFGLEATLRM